MMMHRLPLSLSLLLLPLFVQAQDSSSITGSATGTAISNISVSGSSTAAVSGSSTASTTASADYPSLSGYSTCVTTCLQLSIAEANCTSVTEVDCYCTNPTFTTSLSDCVIDPGDSGCPAELSEAENLASQFCDLAVSSTSLSFTITSVASASSSVSSSAASSGSTTASSTGTSASATSTDNAAAGVVVGQTTSSIVFSAVVVLVCAAIGGHLVV